MLNFCLWVNDTILGDAMRSSIWVFPVVEIFHILGLSVLGGTLLIVNMRLLGLRNQPMTAATLWKDVQPWMLGGLAFSLLSGFLLFSSEATRLYYNPAFRYKMAFLAASLFFTFTAHRQASLSENRMSPLTLKLVAIVSVLLWTGVGIGGRLIGYLE